MSDKSSIRAAVTKDFVEALDATEPGLHERVLGALPKADREAIDRALRIGWLPLSVHLGLNEITRELVGAEAFRRAWVAGMVRTFEQPILKPIVEAGIRLFGLSPMTFVRLTPKAWDLIIRDGGRVTSAVESERRGRIDLESFPPDLLRSDTFFVGLVGVFESFFTIARTTGTVTLGEHDARRGRATWLVEVAAAAPVA